MKAFISSVISGFGDLRDAAAEAVKALRHEAIRAEDFGASTATPQQVCLEGVRRADFMVLLLGGRYGDLQPSGMSATQEEFREARDRMEVMAFVQDGVSAEEEPALSCHRSVR